MVGMFRTQSIDANLSEAFSILLNTVQFEMKLCALNTHFPGVVRF